jgi:hypothetical protein
MSITDRWAHRWLWPFAALRRRCKSSIARWRLRRAVTAIRQRPTPSSIELLRRGWANTGFSADVEFLQAVAQHARNARAVLECGSGASTVLLGALDVPTWSLEHHPEWRARVTETLDDVGAKQVKVLDAPLRRYGELDWYELPAGLPDHFDLVVCDGPPSDTRGGRMGLLEVLGDKLKESGAIVLLDDSNRPAEAELVAAMCAAGWRSQLTRSRSKSFTTLTAHPLPTAENS